VDFREWLVLCERTYVDHKTVEQLERAFDQGLDQLIARLKNPALRDVLVKAKQCRVRDASGRCRGFVDYLLGSLVNHGLYREYDLEDVLNFMVFQLIGTKKSDGTPKLNLFTGFDESRPITPGTNPLEARFKTAVANLVRTVALGKVPRLRTLNRPAGTLSIRARARDDPSTGIAPDAIPAKPSGGEEEMVHDIEGLLRRLSPPGMDLVGVFRTMIAGQGTRQQRSQFGDRQTRLARKIIVQTIGEYAKKTQNWGLIRLLDKFKDFHGTDPDLAPRLRPQTALQRSPEERDFRSVAQVMERSGRRATSSLLGSMRRRWLERAPRNPGSPHQTRLDDVLAKMVEAGVLVRRGAAVVPGPNYGKYVDAGAVAAPGMSRSVAAMN
jgi:hypothetical protein